MVGNDGDESHGSMGAKTYIFRGCNPYYVHFWGVKPSCFMVLVSKGMQ